MGGPTGVGPFECNLRATRATEDPCLQENPNRPLDPATIVALDGRAQPTGWASWYARGFHGRVTATGEVFDTYDYTIAMREKHWHGQLVKIERLDAAGQPQPGAVVIARVTDWGPAEQGADGTPIRGKDGRARAADLSKAVYYALGGDPAGQVRIRITAVAPTTAEGIAAPRWSSMLIDMLPNARAALEKKWTLLRTHTLPAHALFRVRHERKYYPRRVDLGYFFFVDAPRTGMLEEYAARIGDMIPADLIVWIPRTR